MLDPNDTDLRNRVRTQLGLKPLEGPLQVGPETDEGLEEEAIPEEEVMEASESQFAMGGEPYSNLVRLFRPENMPLESLSPKGSVEWSNKV